MLPGRGHNYRASSDLCIYQSPTSFITYIPAHQLLLCPVITSEFVRRFSSYSAHNRRLEQSVGERPPQYARPLWSWHLTFWLWKWCPSHVWRGLPLCQILSFLGLSVLELDPMHATDRQTSDIRRASSLNALPIRGGGIVTYLSIYKTLVQ